MFLTSNGCILCFNTYKDHNTISVEENEWLLVQERLRYCLPEIADSHLETPKYICSDCMSKLDCFHKFKQSCLRNLQNFTSTEETHKNLLMRSTEDNPDVEFVNCETISNDFDVSVSDNEDEAINKDISCDNLLFNKGNDIVMKKQCPTSEDQADIEFVNCESSLHDSDVSVSDNEDSKYSNNSSEDTLTKPEENNTTVKQQNKKSNKYKCTVCGNKYLHKNSLENHLKVHAGIKDFCCSICDKKFTCKFNMSAHENMHKGIKKFGCRICNKKFTLKAVLAQHEIIHSGDRNFECTTCKKKFMRKGDLKIHEKTHSDIRNFECSVCKRKFLRKDHWILHEKNHSGIRNFQCKICKKTFTRKADTVRHEKLHARIELM